MTIPTIPDHLKGKVLQDLVKHPGITPQNQPVFLEDCTKIALKAPPRMYGLYGLNEFSISTLYLAYLLHKGRTLRYIALINSIHFINRKYTRDLPFINSVCQHIQDTLKKENIEIGQTITHIPFNEDYKYGTMISKALTVTTQNPPRTHNTTPVFKLAPYISTDPEILTVFANRTLQIGMTPK